MCTLCSGQLEASHAVQVLDQLKQMLDLLGRWGEVPYPASTLACQSLDQQEQAPHVL